MKIKLVLFGELRQRLPAGSDFNAAWVELAEGSGLADTLSRLDLARPGDRFMVIINDDKVSEDTLHEIKLRDGDVVTCAPPIKGGQHGCLPKDPRTLD